MSARAIDFRTDGNTALNFGLKDGSKTARAVIIEFPGPRPSSSRDLSDASTSLFHRLLATSEMYCSLALEDARGVAYGLFSRRSIASLSAASFVVASLAIAFGS